MTAITSAAVAAKEDLRPSFFASGAAIVAWVACVRIALYFLAGPHYGYFRDELYYPHAENVLPGDMSTSRC
jgi:hypothetical protein